MISFFLRSCVIGICVYVLIVLLAPILLDIYVALK